MTYLFAHPWVLLLLLGLPVLAWLKGRSGARPAFLYSSLALLEGFGTPARSRSGSVLAALRWLALACFIIALARPQLGEGETRVTASGVDIVIALDLSGSMASEDFKLKGEQVNRLTVAKNVIEQFVDKRPNDRIGLVAFAGRAYVAAPLTLDHNFLLQNLERLRLGLIEDNTAIGAGLSCALNRLRDVNSKSKLVILMTDGQNNAGKVPPLTAAEAASALGVKVYTIGVGIRGTAPFPRIDPFGRKVYYQVPVDIDEPTLEQIADKTGGRYFRADSSDTLQKIYAEIDRLEKTDIDVKKFMQYRELFAWFVIPGVLLLLAEVVLGNTIWRRVP
jgi:Ca-activated chloride channel family protein